MPSPTPDVSPCLRTMDASTHHHPDNINTKEPPMPPRTLHASSTHPRSQPTYIPHPIEKQASHALTPSARPTYPPLFHYEHINTPHPRGQNKAKKPLPCLHEFHMSRPRTSGVRSASISLTLPPTSPLPYARKQTNKKSITASDNKSITPPHPIPEKKQRKEKASHAFTNSTRVVYPPLESGRRQSRSLSPPRNPPQQLACSPAPFPSRGHRRRC